MKRNKKNVKNTRKIRGRKSRRSCGGGWDDNPSKFVSPGYVVHAAYSGQGKDCTPTPVQTTSRINPAEYSGSRGGLPGMSGGRWGFGSPETWTVASNGNGAAFAQYADKPCEPTDPRTVGLDDLNKLKADSFGASNLALPVAVKAFPPPYGAKGGAAAGLMGEPAPAGLTPGQTSSPSSGMEGRYYPGDSDTRAYYAPTAGYSNVPMNPVVVNNPGIMIQPPYDARSYNQACIKTGGRRTGGRRTKKNVARRNKRDRSRRRR